MTKTIEENIDIKYLKKMEEREELVEIAKELDVQDSVYNLCYHGKYNVNLHLREDLTGKMSYVDGYNNLILYEFVKKGENLNNKIEKFETECSMGVKKFENSRRKLSKEFKSTLRMFICTNGRVTLVDKKTDLILLDKVKPTNFDYQRAQKKFLINRNILKQR